MLFQILRVITYGKIVDSVAHLIKPPTREFIFTYIHGLTWQHVAAATDFGLLWPQLAPWLDGVDFLAAHNASFDRGVLNACCAAYEIAAALPAFRCTVTMARRAWNLRPTKLPDVCRHLGITLDHHDALSDAMACAKIVIAAELCAVDQVLLRKANGRSEPARHKNPLMPS